MTDEELEAEVAAKVARYVEEERERMRLLLKEELSIAVAVVPYPPMPNLFDAVKVTLLLRGEEIASGLEALPGERR